MNRFRDDDDAQVDGDSSGAVSFDRRGAGVPWLRSPMPPWHLWGNTQRVEVLLPLALSFGEVGRGQLTRVSYKRPETWNWLFTARLLEADDADPLEPLQLQIVWELTVGIGRAVQQSLGFDNWNISWGTPVTPTDNAPVGRLIWATETYAASPERSQFVAPAVQPLNRIDRIVAQDIQLNARVALLSPVVPRTNNKRAVVELGAQWAPSTHVRPDWFADGPIEIQFPGGENQGT